jgi:hypothetical protein
MNALKRTLVAIAASSAIAPMWLAASTPPALADARTDLVAGNVLVCDTPEEVEAVLTSEARDFAARLGEANDRFGQQACSVVTAIFYKGDETKTVLSQDGAVHIIKVDLIGFRAGDAWLRMAKPAVKYAGMLEDSTNV